jgi:polyphosphate kinase
VTPVEDKVNKERLWEVLQIMINDTVQAWSMQSDGTYRKKESTDAKATGTHDALMGISKQKWKQAKEEMAKRKEETAEQNGAIQ